MNEDMGKPNLDEQRTTLDSKKESAIHQENLWDKKRTLWLSDHRGGQDTRKHEELALAS